MPQGVAQSFATPNYSGMLFNRGNTKTPLSSMIGLRKAISNSVEFVLGQEYTTGGGSQPAISETASLTAPTPDFITRSQETNVTQIFHETFGVSYAKESNMGTLQGVNIANQQANPMSELDFQAAAKMVKIANDIEYTFINGVYQKATADNVANKTRGLVSAISTNEVALGGKTIDIWDVAEAMKLIDDENAPIDDLVLGIDVTTRLQLNANAVENGLTIVPAGRDINGINIEKLETPVGDIYLKTLKFLPAGTALVLNIGMLRPVEMLVPQKGNFFMEELAKTGAGKTYQIFGQVGLDYGYEFAHAKITGISTSFAKPDGVRKVYITGQATS